MVARLYSNGVEVRVDLGCTGRQWPDCGEQYQPGFPWLSFGVGAWDAAERWATAQGATAIVRDTSTNEQERAAICLMAVGPLG